MNALLMASQSASLTPARRMVVCQLFLIVSVMHVKIAPASSQVDPVVLQCHFHGDRVLDFLKIDPVFLHADSLFSF